MRLVILILLLFVTALSGGQVALAEEYQRGDWIVVTQGGDLTADEDPFSQVVDQLTAGKILKVEESKGKRIRLHHRSQEGWFPSGSVKRNGALYHLAGQPGQSNSIDTSLSVFGSRVPDFSGTPSQAAPSGQFEELLQTESQDAPSYRRRAEAWNSEHEYDKAITDYSEAIRLNPQDAKHTVFVGGSGSRSTSTTRRLLT